MPQGKIVRRGGGSLGDKLVSSRGGASSGGARVAQTLQDPVHGAPFSPSHSPRSETTLSPSS